MSLNKISLQIANANINHKHTPMPVETWDPPFCGNIDLQIKSDGSWFYNGTIFKRLSLVKLLASVLKKENDNYYLVTPVEKIGIEVEDAPFLITQWQWLDAENTLMQVTTNLDEEFILDKNHPLIIDHKDNLYVTVRNNLSAKVHRNVYYQWVNIAKEEACSNATELCFYSTGKRFVLGVI